MCGIVGAILKYDNGFLSKSEDSFFQMLYVDTLRGQDSTGVIGVDKHGGFYTAKEAMEAPLVIPSIKDEKFYKDVMGSSKGTGKAWIGHNRKSTVGKTTDANAHPFEVNGEFAFVHNGTLTSHKHLADVEVDSEALAIAVHKAMGEADWKTALEELLGKVHGAYACSWYDARTEKVYLLRNIERPLSIIEVQNAYYWASEPAMALWILTRNDHKYEECKHHVIMPHSLIEFNLGDKKTEMTVTELVPKKAPLPATSTKKHGGVTVLFGRGTGTTSKEEKGGVVSKGQLKAFRRTWVNHIMRFWVEDYTERLFPLTFPDDAAATELLLMGESETILIPHVIRATIDTKELGLHFAEDITERIWMGRVSSVSYDDKRKMLELHLTGCKPIVTAPLTNASERPVWPWPTHTTPPAPSCPVAPMTPARKLEILERVLEKKTKEFNDKGITVMKSVTPTGKFVLFNAATQEKLYESAIIVH